MRDIRFSGKKIDTGEWAYGYYVKGSTRHCILPDLGGIMYDVDPDTVGQFTGLKDGNGKDIYEGDILSSKRCVYGVVDKHGNVHEVFGGDDSDKMFVEWDEKIVAELKTTEHSISFYLPTEDGTYQNRGKKLEWEIIGNIYENPELLTK